MLAPKQLDTDPTYGEQPTLLFEDQDILVLSKPPGWLTHPDGAGARPALTTWHQSPLGVHSRLDVDTSGVVAFSKSETGARALGHMDHSNSAEKTYLAVVEKAPESQAGVWTDRMPDGKTAKLRYEVVSQTENYCVLKVVILTGRTHQIRYQCAQRGYPIVGDGRYGDPIDRRAPRTLLHSLSIRLPSGQVICADTPDDFAQALGSPPADARRALNVSGHTNAYRLYNGKADGHAGWIVDRYGDFVWVRQDFGVDLGPIPSAKGVYGLLAPKDRSHHENPGATHLSGQASPASVWVQENGVLYEVRFEGERSTGMFLDQRPQRAWLKEHSQGMEILNTFAHAGAFSIAASVAGASSLNLDLSKKWLSRIEPQIIENGGRLADHSSLSGDVFEWLPRLKKQGRLFDIVILDPPSTSVGKKRKRWSASKQYSELVALAAPLVKPGGRLWASTNHRQTLPRVFAQRVHQGLSKDFYLEKVCPQGVDHPTLGPPPLKVHVWKRAED